jgi:hypothetical protein
VGSLNTQLYILSLNCYPLQCLSTLLQSIPAFQHKRCQWQQEPQPALEQLATSVLSSHRDSLCVSSFKSQVSVWCDDRNLPQMH